LYLNKKNKISYVNKRGNCWIIKIKSGTLRAIPLPPFCFVDQYYSVSNQDHEYGHYKQSLILGPLYIIIAIIIFSMHILTKLKILKIEKYYKRWPEQWADKLGWVRR
jgi:hypothetical protein